MIAAPAPGKLEKQWNIQTNTHKEKEGKNGI